MTNSNKHAPLGATLKNVEYTKLHVVQKSTERRKKQGVMLRLQIDTNSAPNPIQASHTENPNK